MQARVRSRIIAALTVGALSLLHYAASMAMLFIVFGHSMRHLDFGTRATLVERLSELAFHVLMFPVGTITEALPFHVRSSFGQHSLWALNSLLWGIALYYGAGWLYRRWRGRRRPAQ